MKYALRTHPFSLSADDLQVPSALLAVPPVKEGVLRRKEIKLLLLLLLLLHIECWSQIQTGDSRQRFPRGSHQLLH